MLTLKVTTVGTSDGLISNNEAKRILNVQNGDTLHPIEAPDGMRITPNTPEFESQMGLAESIMHDDREILRALAK